MNLEKQLKRKIVDGICYFLIKVFTVGLIVREMALASTMILLINEMVRKVKSILIHQEISNVDVKMKGNFPFLIF